MSASIALLEIQNSRKRNVKMSLLKWSNFFSTGIEEIDNQHKKLLELLNELHDGVLNNKGDDAINSVLPKLLAYTKEHFVFEEKFMIESEFPGYDKHFQKHFELSEQVEQLCEDMRDGVVINQLELAVFLADWLKEHIMEEDMEYARYAVAKEAKIL